ncbi:hypothetical protein T4D_8900 [Trichinella pseudospiralis]|uniref:Uncharacterized protein n=1 Tax=Trichinella pseudospiralis TaxID=6337 RepID=A0A0V1G1A7_TRIPS|nr:hypothetical protein T4D_8900 [Trichinella pseudospiralis]
MTQASKQATPQGYNDRRNNYPQPFNIFKLMHLHSWNAKLAGQKSQKCPTKVVLVHLTQLSINAVLVRR